MMELSSAHFSPSMRSGDNEHLSQALDKSLERYLNLLDQYQTLQQDLAEILASVCLELLLVVSTMPKEV